MRAARLVETEKQGLYVIYRPADQAVCEFFHAVRILAESRLAEVELIEEGIQDFRAMGFDIAVNEDL